MTYFFELSPAPRSVTLITFTGNLLFSIVNVIKNQTMNPTPSQNVNYNSCNNTNENNGLWNENDYKVYNDEVLQSQQNTRKYNSTVTLGLSILYCPLNDSNQHTQ